MSLMDTLRLAGQKVRTFMADRNKRNYVLLAIGIVLPCLWGFVNFDSYVDNKAAARKLTAGAYTTTVIAFFWMTEVLPIAVTALLPVIFFPILGVTTAKEISSAYFNDTIFLMIGSFIFAVSMEKWNLHRKLALKFLLLIGERPRMMMAGFMAITAFLSMWISNTATTSMMTPLVLAVLGQLSQTRGANQSESRLRPAAVDEPTDLDTTQLEMDGVDITPRAEVAIELDYLAGERTHATNHDEDYKRFSKASLLGIAYSASIGGTATLVGTGTNVILVQTFSRLFPKAPPISFSGWFFFATPLAILLLLCSFGLLVLLFTRNTNVSISRRHLEIEHARVGPLTWAQVILVFDLLFMVTAWFIRPILTNKGILKSGYITDGTISMFAGLILFIIPSLQQVSIPGALAHQHRGEAENFASNSDQLAEGLIGLEEDDAEAEGSNSDLRSEDISNDSKQQRDSAQKRGDRAQRSEAGENLANATPSHSGRVRLEGDEIGDVDNGYHKDPHQGRHQDHNNCGDDEEAKATKKRKSMLRLADKDTLMELPWDIVLLLGGGLALAEGFQVSGLSIVLAKKLAVLSSLPLFFSITLVCMVVLFTTELTSNVATITLVLPILAAMAQSTHQHPLLLMIPATICCSLAFMLPVATPPNAIVFSANALKVSDMAKAGLLLNVASLLLVPVYMIAVGSSIFGINFKEFPTWALPNTPTTTPVAPPS